MGFRDLEVFNVTILAKQGWILQNLDSLIATPKSTLFPATLFHGRVIGFPAALHLEKPHPGSRGAGAGYLLARGKRCQYSCFQRHIYCYLDRASFTRWQTQ